MRAGPWPWAGLLGASQAPGDSTERAYWDRFLVQGIPGGLLVFAERVSPASLRSRRDRLRHQVRPRYRRVTIHVNMMVKISACAFNRAPERPRARALSARMW